MYCPNCGKQIPDSARVCGFCGTRLNAATPQPAPQPAPQPLPQQPAPIIVHTSGSGGGLFSGCSGLLNLLLSGLVIALIAGFVMVFLCVIRLPADFPIIDPPVPVNNLWERAVDWQAQNCSQRAEDEELKNTGETGANDCNRSKFVKETIPDHTVFAPGEKFQKTWTVRNDGSCTWGAGYTFRFTQGTRMGGPKSITLDRDVKPGETYTFELDLIAPDDPGTYTGRWEIFDADGNSFGWYSVIIDVIIEGEEPKPLPDATVMVDPAMGAKCTNFTITFSGYAPNEQINLEFAYFTDAGVYSTTAKVTADGNGKATYKWYADVTVGGQYIVWGRSDSAVGSAVFIVEAADECTCDGVCPAGACTEAQTKGDCEAAGGEWRHIYVDPGPSIDACVCPGVPFIN